jgi:hypothetical protein
MAVMEAEEFVVVFDVVRMPVDELDELFMASGDGRREFRVEEDGNRFGRGDMGAMRGAEVEFEFELPAKSEGVSLLLLLLFSFGLCLCDIKICIINSEKKF